MAIYDGTGTQLNACYDGEGNALQYAYDGEGNLIFTSRETDLKVMTYNIGQWYIGDGSNVPTAKYSDYYALQRGMLASDDADIVGFQEYYDPFSSGHTVESVIGEYFTNHVNNAVSGYSAKAIYSNGYALSNYEEVPFVNGAGRNYIKASIVVNGKTVWIINAHLDTSNNESAKVAQAQELFDAVENLEYFIILADFNTVCKSTSDEEYTTIMKQFIDAGYHSANCSAQHGFIDTWTDGTTSSGTWYPCDQIITSANIDMLSVYTDRTKVTDNLGDVIDHIPLIAELAIN